jgi:hypothetical protein
MAAQRSGIDHGRAARTTGRLRRRTVATLTAAAVVLAGATLAVNHFTASSSTVGSQFPCHIPNHDVIWMSCDCQRCHLMTWSMISVRRRLSARAGRNVAPRSQWHVLSCGRIGDVRETV